METGGKHDAAGMAAGQRSVGRGGHGGVWRTDGRGYAATEAARLIDEKATPLIKKG